MADSVKRISSTTTSAPLPLEASIRCTDEEVRDGHGFKAYKVRNEKKNWNILKKEN
jgi:hypothetical protein